MDSDDDFMSGLSSDEDALQDESDDDNGSADGMSRSFHFPSPFSCRRTNLPHEPSSSPLITNLYQPTDFGFDEPEPDLGYTQKDEVKKEKKSFDTTFKVYEPKDIQAQQDDLIDEVNMILDIRKEDAAILLRHSSKCSCCVYWTSMCSSISTLV